MNTIEQARDVSECLRALTRNRNDGSAYLIAADTIDALLAELERIKSQEPVAWGQPDAAGNIIESISPEEKTGEMKGWAAQYTAPLYLAAGAQTIAASYQLVPVEPTKEMIVALMCTGLRHAEYKRGCDPTLTHMEQGYKAMLAAAPVQAGAPFTPDWASYRQGMADGIAEAQERKPLTDAEICEALGIDGADDWTYTVARAIEQAHGITGEQP